MSTLHHIGRQRTTIGTLAALFILSLACSDDGSITGANGEWSTTHHPASLHGNWTLTVTYTESADGNPSQWNYSDTLTLIADGSVGPHAIKGFWWAYDDVLIVAHPWKNENHMGVECLFLTLTSDTRATGKFEDKNMSGAGWWGRGDAVMGRM